MSDEAEKDDNRTPRQRRIDEIMRICHALHGDTLRELAKGPPDGLSDEDHEAYGAMLHAMTPREDRKD